jgi:hypothetical protein
MLTFTRHISGEKLLAKMGIRGTQQWKSALPWVHYMVAFDVTTDRWTASYQLNPALTGGVARTVHVDHGAMPTILSPNQPGPMPAYDSKEAAVSACNTTHAALKGKFGL